MRQQHKSFIVSAKGGAKCLSRHQNYQLLREILIDSFNNHQIAGAIFFQNAIYPVQPQLPENSQYMEQEIKQAYLRSYMKL